jgi:hypothetical protein
VQRKHIKVHPSVIRFHRRATVSREALGDLPIACVGTVATGADRYRKLVEIAVVRYEHDKEVLRMSTLIQPERDASQAVLAGINASELSLAPRLEEVQPFIALALNNAVVVSTDTEEVLENMRFVAGQVLEGVGISINTPMPDDTGRRPGALAIAELVAKCWRAIPRKKRAEVLVTPFSSNGWITDATPYLFSRDAISSPEEFFKRCLAGRERQWNPDLMLGYFIGVISRPESPSQISAGTIGFPVKHDQAVRLGEVLLQRAKEDQIVTAFEKDFLQRAQTVLGCSLGDVPVGDFREKVSLEPGMRVYVSGGPGRSGSTLEGLRKERIKEMCRDAGLIFEDKFQKKTGIQVLAVADLGNVTGGSFDKARRWGIPVISWEELVEWAGS